MAAVDNLKESGDCTFIADFYWNVKDILCGEMLPAVVNISMVMMLAAVFSIPMIGTAIWMKVLSHVFGHFSLISSTPTDIFRSNSI